MEREYKEITTPISGVKIKLKSWLTGREQRAIRAVLLEGVSFAPTENDPTKPTTSYELSAKALDNMQDTKLTTVVVSVNDKTDNILDLLLELHHADYEFVVGEVNKITDSFDEDSKKK